MKRTRKFLASLLALALCLSLLPGTALAADSAFDITGGTANTDYTYSNGVLTVKNGANLTISMAGGATTPTSDRIVVESNASASITLNGVNIKGTDNDGSVTKQTSAITLSPGSSLTLTLAQGSSNTLAGGSGSAHSAGAPAINVPEGTTLTVLCSNEDDNDHICGENCGSLSATGGSATTDNGGVGIGGGTVASTSPGGLASSENCGTVLLLGGNITVSGGSGQTATANAVDIGGANGTNPGTGGTVIILTQVSNSNDSLKVGGGSSGTGSADNGAGIKPSPGENTYEVYGNLTLPDSLTIPEGVTVTIPSGATLTVPENVTLTNNGTIVNNGTITVDSGGAFTNNGDVSGNGSLTNNGTVTKKQQTATAPTEDDVTTTETSITVQTVAGQKYAVTDTQTAPAVGADTWTEATGTSLTFDTLTAGTTYYIWTYKPGNDYYEDSAVSAALAVTTEADAVAVTGVSLDKSELSLKVGGTATLTAAVTPEDATDKTVTWSTDNSSVATVNNGVVAAVAPGEATITVTTTEGGYTAQCAVTVVPAATPVEPGGIVRYIVEHYKEGGNNYFLVETEYPAGEIGKTVTAQPKDYPGYVYNAALSNPSGTLTAIQGEEDILTLRLYYDEEPRPSRPGGGSSQPSYTVSVPDADHGAVTVSPSRAQAGDEVTVTVTPDEGYALDELTVTDRDGEAVRLTENRDGTFSFEMPASRVTIQATFVPLAEEPVTPPTAWNNPFTDVAPGAWYYDSVGYVYANGVMTGTTATTFSPDTTTTRAQLWTILARLNGQNVAGGSPWYAAAQQWAVSAGVSDGTDPDGPITREQLAAMLYRAAGSPAVSGNLLAYPDGNAVSPWAESAMLWATQQGIITGLNGALSPQTSATRAQVAAMLARAQ